MQLPRRQRVSSSQSGQSAIADSASSFSSSFSEYTSAYRSADCFRSSRSKSWLKRSMAVSCISLSSLKPQVFNWPGKSACSFSIRKHVRDIFSLFPFKFSFSKSIILMVPPKRIKPKSSRISPKVPNTCKKLLTECGEFGYGYLFVVWDENRTFLWRRILQ